MWVCRVTYGLGLASSSGDVSDPVVLDATWSWIPPGVHAGDGFVEHNQVGGRSLKYWKTRAHTQITIKTMSLCLSVICSESTFSIELLKNIF